MSALANWLLADLNVPEAAHATHEGTHSWWQVMCLTGVDYFSSLGYAPGIAFLAAGALSPVATLILVAVTLFAALPAYRKVAEASPHGQGSIAMLEKLFPSWQSKLFVLILLGFATTDFIITITLSAADGAAHFVENPYVPQGFSSQFGVTVVVLAILAFIFLRGFKEAITIAVALVSVYLVLNAIVCFVAIGAVLHDPSVIARWKATIFHEHSNPMAMLGVALLLFPRLALGMSGFETGVAVMPLIKSENEASRVRNTKKLLVSAAAIMSIFLIATSFTTTLLIPANEFREGGKANGRAVAYLAHRYLGDGFGTVYDFSTILILGFAGASAMAGLLNLIPRYLPRYGMAPDIARGNRPNVLVISLVALVVTIFFHANVDAQGGAYATGVLVLMSSAAIAVAISMRARGGLALWGFSAIALVFVYTTAVNMIERPEGLKISSVFIASILLSSFVSRVFRSTELRVTKVVFDPVAEEILRNYSGKTIRLVTRRTRTTVESVEELETCIREAHQMEAQEDLMFFEVERGDSQDFASELCVKGKVENGYRILQACSPAIPNAIAALLIELTKRTGQPAHVYFTWPQGNPFLLLFNFLFFGDGYTAPLTHEILRQNVKNRAERPVIHVT